MVRTKANARKTSGGGSKKKQGEQPKEREVVQDIPFGLVVRDKKTNKILTTSHEPLPNTDVMKQSTLPWATSAPDSPKASKRKKGIFSSPPKPKSQDTDTTKKKKKKAKQVSEDATTAKDEVTDSSDLQDPKDDSEFEENEANNVDEQNATRQEDAVKEPVVKKPKKLNIVSDSESDNDK